MRVGTYCVFGISVLRVYRFTAVLPTCLSSNNLAYLFTIGMKTRESSSTDRWLRVADKDLDLCRFCRRLSSRCDDYIVLTTKATAAAAAAATTSGRGRDDGTTAFGLTLRRWRPNNPSAAGQRGTAAVDDYTRLHHRHRRP